MRAYLVRIGIDQAFGGWNAPVDPRTNEYVYAWFENLCPELVSANNP
jgi:hypothetical protein